MEYPTEQAQLHTKNAEGHIECKGNVNLINCFVGVCTIPIPLFWNIVVYFWSSHSMQYEKVNFRSCPYHLYTRQCLIHAIRYPLSNLEHGSKHISLLFSERIFVSVTAVHGCCCKLLKSMFLKFSISSVSSVDICTPTEIRIHLLMRRRNGESIKLNRNEKERKKECIAHL